MNKIDKNTLAVLYACSINGNDPFEAMSKTLFLSEIRTRLDRLKQNGLSDGNAALTKKGRDSIRVVLTGGVFDIIHPGHAHTLNAAKALGDVLVVVVATDDTARRMKRKIPQHSKEERQQLTDLLEMVDVCRVGQKDIFRTVEIIRPDVIALGYDQAHHEKSIKTGCERLGIEAKIVRLQSPMPGISSSKLTQDAGVTYNL